MLSIYAIVNSLRTCLHPYLIRSSTSDTVELSELINTMAQGRTTLSKPDISGCLQLFVEELVKLVADGKYVKTPVGAFYLAASGKLDYKNQSFTPGEGILDHGLTLHFRTDKAVESTIKSNARWERIESFDTSAAAFDEVSLAGRAVGETARAGDSVRITGRRLKFDPADATCGVFLETATASYRVAVYPDIAPSKLIAVLPADIPAGSYDLIVATRPNGRDLKEGYHASHLLIA